jgi:hypothetical protein
VQGRGGTHDHRTPQPGGPSHTIDRGQSEEFRHEPGAGTSTGGPASAHMLVHPSIPGAPQKHTVQRSTAQVAPTGQVRPSGSSHAGGGPASTHARSVHESAPPGAHTQTLQPSGAGQR